MNLYHKCYDDIRCAVRHRRCRRRDTHTTQPSQVEHAVLVFLLSSLQLIFNGSICVWKAEEHLRRISFFGLHQQSISTIKLKFLFEDGSFRCETLSNNLHL